MICKPDTDPRRLLQEPSALALSADTLMAGTLRLQLADHTQRVAVAEKTLARAEAAGAPAGDIAAARARLAQRVARRDAVAQQAAAADIRKPAPDPDRAQVFGRVTGSAGQPPLTAALVEGTGQPLASACVKDNGSFLLAADGGVTAARLQITDSDQRLIFRDRDAFDLGPGETILREVALQDPGTPCTPPPRQATMPDLIGQSERLACAVLTRLGVAEIDIARAPDPGPPGLVIAQTPAAGAALAPGQGAALTISAPREGEPPPEPEPLILPDLVGRPLTEARAILAQLDLRMEARLRDDAAPEGTVLEQDPAAGSEMAPGALVTLVASSGTPPVQTAEVPGVVGLPEAEATAILENAGFSVARRSVPNPNRPGQVVTQTPPGGSTAPLGSVVTLTVGAPLPGEGLLEVPDFRGMDVKEAHARASEMGFAVTVVMVASDAPRGEVLAQEPAAGNRVPPGSPGSLTLGASEGPRPVDPPTDRPTDRLTVPDFRGQPGDTAARQAARLGFEVTTRQVASDRPAGEVTAHSPTAGTVLTAPGVLRLDLSRGPSRPMPLPDPLRPVTPTPPPTDGDLTTGRTYTVALAEAAARDERLSRLVALDAPTLGARLEAAGVQGPEDLQRLIDMDNEELRDTAGLDGLAQARSLRSVLRSADPQLDTEG